MTAVADIYVPKRGDTVRWVGEYGFDAAPVVSVSDKNIVRIYTREGTYIHLELDRVAPVYDARMQSLRALDEGGPDDRVSAHLKREGYVENWMRTYRPQDTEDATPRQRSKARTASFADEVLAIVENSKWPVGRAEILEKVEGLTPAQFTAAIIDLKNQKAVTQVGKRKAACYVIPGKEYTEERPKATTSKSSKSTEISEDILSKLDEILAFMKVGTPYSRAMIMEGCKVTQVEWIELAKLLKASNNIVVTGAKRGTRYGKKN